MSVSERTRPPLARRAERVEVEPPAAGRYVRFVFSNESCGRLSGMARASSEAPHALRLLLLAGASRIIAGAVEGT